MCHCYHHKIVAAKQGQAIACELSCKQWGCPDCGHKRRDEWESRFKEFASLGTEFQITTCCTWTRFHAVTQRIRRHHGQYISVRIARQYHVFHSAIDEMMPRKQMLAEARLVLDKALAAKHDVRISASTSVPYPPQKRRSWVGLAKTALSPEELNRRLASRGHDACISLGKVFPVKLIAALIGEGFELCASVLRKPERLIREAGTSLTSLMCFRGEITPESLFATIK